MSRRSEGFDDDPGNHAFRNLAIAGLVVGGVIGGAGVGNANDLIPTGTTVGRAFDAFGQRVAYFATPAGLEHNMSAVIGVLADGAAAISGSGTESVPEPSTAAIPSPSLSPSVVQSAPPTAETPSFESCIAAMPVSTRLGQLFVIGVKGDELADTQSFLAENEIGGVILMTSPSDINDGSIKRLKESQPIPLLVTVDVEGGKPGTGGDGGVNRFDKTIGPLASAEEVVRTQTPEETKQIITDYGKVLDGIGVDAVFGPVLDVIPKDGESPLAPRAFSRDPNVVTEYGRAVVEGWQEADIMPVVKHAPGGMRKNTDFNAKVEGSSIDEMRGRDLIPFEQLADTGAGLMMANHVPRDSGGIPAGQNRAIVTDLMRNELGYDGLIFTDALDAKAVIDPVDAAKKSLVAGNTNLVIAFPPENETMGSFMDKSLSSLDAAVQSGEYPEAELNGAVGINLTAKGVTFDASCNPVVKP